MKREMRYGDKLISIGQPSNRATMFKMVIGSVHTIISSYNKEIVQTRGPVLRKDGSEMVETVYWYKDQFISYPDEIDLRGGK